MIAIKVKKIKKKMIDLRQNEYIQYQRSHEKDHLHFEGFLLMSSDSFYNNIIIIIIPFLSK